MPRPKNPLSLLQCCCVAIGRATHPGVEDAYRGLQRWGYPEAVSRVAVCRTVMSNFESTMYMEVMRDFSCRFVSRHDGEKWLNMFDLFGAYDSGYYPILLHYVGDWRDGK
jgi:hypothetical protein